MQYAFFISPHGFGHASRCLAVMERLLEFDPTALFHVFTTVPRPFFEETLSAKMVYHRLACDVGFVQCDPFRIDFPATEKALSEFFAGMGKRVASLARQLRNMALVICDIASLGIAAGRRAGVKTVLLESFTWDWMYAFYGDRQPGLLRWQNILQETYSAADFHIQTEPLCAASPKAHLRVGPIARHPRCAPEQTRRSIGIDSEEKAVLVSLGGLGGGRSLLRLMAGGFRKDLVFVVPVATNRPCRRENVVQLPHHGPVRHVDVVYAVDALICKAGYSTLAEAYGAGVAVGTIMRDDFPESPAMEKFVHQYLGGQCFKPQCLVDGTWVHALPSLLRHVKKTRPQEAAATVARYLLSVA